VGVCVCSEKTGNIQILDVKKAERKKDFLCHFFVAADI
jgi:hypothetical protein